jgi:hypothetical protein
VPNERFILLFVDIGISLPDNAAASRPLESRLSPDRNDARYPGKVKVYYSLHPLFGQDVPVFRRYGRGESQQVEVQLAGRRQGVPGWMTDEDRCARFSLGTEPRCSLASLLELVRLLQASGL